MTTPVSSNFSPRALAATSADEAVALTRATEIFQADTFIGAALKGLQTAKPLLDQFLRLSQTASLIAKRASGSFTPITVSNLDSTEKSVTALRAFFNADGPVLGSNLDEANSNYAALAAAGIQLVAPIQIPVLIEIDRIDGKSPTKSIAWLESDQISVLSAFPKSSDSAYPGSTERKSEVRDSKGKILQVTRYTIFDGYANRRPSLTSLADGLVQLNEMVRDAAEQLALELKFAQRAAAEADRKIEGLEVFAKGQNALIKNIESANEELIESSLRLMQFLHRERQLLIIRQEVLDKKNAIEQRTAVPSSTITFSAIENGYESVFSGNDNFLQSAGLLDNKVDVVKRNDRKVDSSERKKSEYDIQIGADDAINDLEKFKFREKSLNRPMKSKDEF